METLMKLPYRQPPVSHAKVRTKTGCLTCRARRKKCDESHPRCVKCAKTGYDCVWPSAEQQWDGRHRRRKSHSASNRDESRQKGVLHLSRDESSKQAARLSQALQLSRLHGSVFLKSSVETAVLNHFMGSFVPLLILSIADPRFHDDVMLRAFHLSPKHRHLEATMLACGAMHMRATSNGDGGDASTPKTPLHYYSDAVAAVSRTVRDDDFFSGLDVYNDNFDALILSVMLLYIYDTWAVDLFAHEDRRHHVHGATQLLKMRFYEFQSIERRRFPLRTVDRIMIESVLFQHFLLSARHPFSTKSRPLDIEFWMTMEAVLGDASSYAELSICDRPILGVLIPVYRLILTILQLNRSPSRRDPATIAAIRQGVAFWEGVIVSNDVEQSTDSSRSGIYDALMAENILAASLMLDWVAGAAPGRHLDPIDIPHGENPQLWRAMNIVRQMMYKDEWTSCYLGMWPLLIFGYAASASEDIALITEDLERRMNVVGMGETVVIRRELEALWAARRDLKGQASPNETNRNGPQV